VFTQPQWDFKLIDECGGAALTAFTKSPEARDSGSIIRSHNENAFRRHDPRQQSRLFALGDLGLRPTRNRYEIERTANA
jgi:hypothetical protein